MRGVVAVDGKTPRGSKQAADGRGALHLLPADACEAGLGIGQCAVDRKSNAIKAIPDLLEMLAIKGTIVSMKKPMTFWRLKAIRALNQSTRHDDVKSFLEEAELAKTCAVHKPTDAGHGRIEEWECRAADAIDGLKERHPDWHNLRGIAAITAKRIAKKTGQTSVEARVY